MPPHRLMLMRHAKSDWSHAGLSDHDRPLNRRGLADAPRMAAWLESNHGIPDVILASTAKRVEGTIDGLMSVWSEQPPIIRNQELYLASPERIMATIRSDSLDSRCILVIAHNPGIGMLASMFANRPLEYPTAAIAIFDFDLSSWTELRAQSQASTFEYGYPKGLAL